MGSKKFLEQTIGRLCHASHIIPTAHLFLHRLCSKTLNVKKAFFTVHLCAADCSALELWLTFHDKAKVGISFNLLANRQPMNILASDSFLGGIGGFSL